MRFRFGRSDALVEGPFEGAVPASRQAIAELRSNGKIGDDAYRAVEEELDLIELASRSAESD